MYSDKYLEDQIDFYLKTWGNKIICINKYLLSWVRKHAFSVILSHFVVKLSSTTHHSRDDQTITHGFTVHIFETGYNQFQNL